MNIAYALLAVSFSITACNNADLTDKANQETEDITPPLLQYELIKELPHDTSSYTEGLLFHDGKLFESTGHTSAYSFSRSLFGEVDTTTGKIKPKGEIDPSKYFGEGIVFLKGKVYQLTDTTHIGFIYDSKTFKKLGEFHYDGDGWGLTTNGHQIIMSNGSSNIIFRDPVSFRPVKTLPVTNNNGPVSNINELELIKGFIYANQWLTNNILKIDTSTGIVVGKLDLGELKARVDNKYDNAQEMNGIAYDSVLNQVYITGKLWPAIYIIRIN